MSQSTGHLEAAPLNGHSVAVAAPVLDRDHIARYIGAIADRLNLSHWRLILADRQEANPDALASIEITYGRRWATILLSHNFAGLSPEEQRHVVVHELLHIHLNPASVALESVQTNIGDYAWGILDCVHRTALEHATDDIADIIAPTMPLPGDIA